MTQELLSLSEVQTKQVGAELAEKFFLQAKAPIFIQLSGTLGAGKSCFARGFIQKWLELCGEPPPESIVSPTYNLVRLYGRTRPVAHFDLYRLKDMGELEQLGFESYFYETPCCLVEWLDLIPEAIALKPSASILVEMEMVDSDNQKRRIKITGPDL